MCSMEGHGVHEPRVEAASSGADTLMLAQPARCVAQQPQQQQGMTGCRPQPLPHAPACRLRPSAPAACGGSAAATARPAGRGCKAGWQQSAQLKPLVVQPDGYSVPPHSSPSVAQLWSGRCSRGVSKARPQQQARLPVVVVVVVQARQLVLPLRLQRLEAAGGGQRKALPGGEGGAWGMVRRWQQTQAHRCAALQGSPQGRARVAGGTPKPEYSPSTRRWGPNRSSAAGGPPPFFLIHFLCKQHAPHQLTG